MEQRALTKSYCSLNEPKVLWVNVVLYSIVRCINMHKTSKFRYTDDLDSNIYEN